MKRLVGSFVTGLCVALLAQSSLYGDEPTLAAKTSERATAPSELSATEAMANVPSGLNDPAFERYVDLALLTHGWNNMDASALTDVALQMAEAERVFVREHKEINANQLLGVAVKVAVLTEDQETLDRLAKVAELQSRSDLKARVASMRKVMDASRGPGAPSVSVENTSAEDFAMYKAILQRIEQAQVASELDTLESIERDLAVMKALTKEQREWLAARIGQHKATLSKSEARPDAAAETLSKLSGASRQWWPPYPYPYNQQYWYRNPYDPGANIAIPGTTSSYSQYVPGVGWVYGNRYIGLDGRPHGSSTTVNPWSGSTTTFYYKKR